jgi:hypoxanthine phosphoribosyltransferase
MNGGIVVAGKLITRLTFPLTIDAINASRYHNQTAGGSIEWVLKPSTPLKDRTILIIDDILDEGLTLAAIHERMLEQGATACYTAVAADKLNGKQKPISADFVALTVPDRFVFGYGMDVRGAWRNLPAIYAMKEE